MLDRHAPLKTDLDTFMAYNQELAQRLEQIFVERPDVTPKKMFGGVAHMLKGNMLVGIVGDELMARVGPGLQAEALARPFAREMDFTGRKMKGFVTVAPAGLTTDSDLRAWISLAEQFVLTLPSK